MEQRETRAKNLEQFIDIVDLHYSRILPQKDRINDENRPWVLRVLDIYEKEMPDLLTKIVLSLQTEHLVNRTFDTGLFTVADVSDSIKNHLQEWHLAFDKHSENERINALYTKIEITAQEVVRAWANTNL